MKSTTGAVSDDIRFCGNFLYDFSGENPLQLPLLIPVQFQ